MNSNLPNVDAKELFELAAIFRALTPDERSFFKRGMLGVIHANKQAKPKTRTAKVYQFKQAA